MTRAKDKHFLAIDLGAESGRGMLARLSDGRVELEEVHRFANEPVKILETIYWDLPRLFSEVKTAIRQAGARVQSAGGLLDGLAVDAWGVDYGLLGPAGELLGNPIHYRDARTDGIMERVFGKMPKEEIFAETGVLFMQYNTLFQLAADLERDPASLEKASRVLMLPDLFTYFLSGRQVSERTIVGTSQLWHPGRAAWSERLLETFGIPAEILPEVLEPGSEVGPLRADIAEEAGLENRPTVIVGACHDTGSAVAAIPAVDPPTGKNETWGFLSSGTWSLFGVELPEPLINDAAREANFTNEDNVGGTVRFLRIIMGLWLVQECRRVWARQGKDYDYATLAEMAESAEPFKSLVVPDDPVFFRPDDMPATIREFARRTKQAVPEDDAAVVRAALESLALTYDFAAQNVHALTGKKISRLHVVGGGSQNRLLNQFTADALGVEVLAGPTEATALGNSLMQALATGAIQAIAELRQIVRDSSEMESFTPRRETAREWAQAREKFRALKESR